MKILLLDCDADRRDVSAQIFQSSAACEVIHAANSADAMDILAQGEAGIDLVVCDLDGKNTDALNFICKLGEAYFGSSISLLCGQGESVLGAAARLCEFYGLNVVAAIEKPLSDELAQSMVSQVSGAIGSDQEASRSVHDLDIARGLRGFQFEALYQPKVSLNTGAVKGVEALARWFHPDLGVISPAKFIKELEESGNIGELTMIMLSQAAAACGRWRQRDIDATVSVNLSIAALKDDAFVDEILEEVQGIGLGNEFIIFELTGTAQLEANSPEMRNLKRLHMHHFGLSVGDFGGPIDGREQLLNVPFTELKINRLYVADMLADEQARNQVESIISMANELGITSVAEGVETQAAWDYLQVAGCDQAQGYFISKPVSETELVVLGKELAPL